MKAKFFLHSVDNGKVILKNVLYVPHIAANLLSVGCISDRDGSVVFKKNKCYMNNNVDKLVLTAAKNNQGIYVVNQNNNNSNNKMILYCSKSPNANESTSIEKVNPADINLWHRRLGHLNESYIKCLAKGAAIGINPKPSQHLSECIACIQGKMCRISFKPSNTRAKSRLELIHIDLGQMDVLSNGKFKYYLTFLDDFSRRCHVAFLKKKSDVAEAFKKFIVSIETQTGDKIRIIRSDNGREYINKNLLNDFSKRGIKHELTVPHNPAQNGRAERVNRILKDKARCMLLDAGLPQSFWAEAFAAAA